MVPSTYLCGVRVARPRCRSERPCQATTMVAQEIQVLFDGGLIRKGMITGAAASPARGVHADLLPRGVLGADAGPDVEAGWCALRTSTELGCGSATC